MQIEMSLRPSLQSKVRVSLALWVLPTLLALAACAAPGPTTREPAITRPAPRAETPRPEEASSQGEVAAQIARRMVGTPYRYGGSSPETGFDCSGLVYYSYTQSGARVPRTSLDQFRAARKISLSEARPGDIVFFQDQAKLSHVGIYLGRGEFVHAPSSGKRVTLAHIDTPYYREHLVAVGRLSRN